MPKTKRRPTRQVTIKDVAKAAGVSVTTVSNVLNNRAEAMTEETLLRVQETIRRLEYRPSSVARSLVNRRTATMGLILNEIETPLFLRALSFIEPIARGAGYNLLLCNARSFEDERHAINLLLEQEVDGIILLLTSVYRDHDYLAQLPVSTPPLVLINWSTNNRRFDQITWDNQRGTVAAVNHLVELGHRHIAHLCGPPSRRSSEERLTGYRLGLEQAGLPYRPDYVRLTDFEASPETWKEATLELMALSPRPTAIIAANDIVAATVMKTIQQAGQRVPRDMTIIGNDDQPFCTYLNPTLTTVQLPIVESGENAIKMLLAQITGQRTTGRHLKLPCPLIVRESSAAPGG